MKLTSLVLLFLAPVVSRAEESPRFTATGHTTDSLKTVEKSVADGRAVLLDVREKKEWDAGHLQDAKLLPLSAIRSGKLTDRQKKFLPRDKPVYCHCRSGGRVLVVSKLLRARGYDIRPLKFGYADLVKIGFERAKHPAQPVSEPVVR